MRKIKDRYRTQWLLNCFACYIHEIVTKKHPFSVSDAFLNPQNLREWFYIMSLNHTVLCIDPLFMEGVSVYSGLHVE